MCIRDRCHDGETGDILTHNVKEGDTITILYDGMEKTLSFGFDGKDPKVAFRDVHSPSNTLYPLFVCDRPLNHTKLHIHSFSTNDDKFLLRKPDTERSKSGYPILASSSFSLSHAIVNIIHQLQHKEGWKQAISRTMKHRFNLMNSLVERLVVSYTCLLYTSPSPRDRTRSRMPSSA